MLCVQEEHTADGDVTNTIVRLDANVPSSPEVLVAGPDFVSNPRWRADGDAYCWLEWDHPAMPWDATRLVVDVAGERTVVAGADGAESVVQPEWAPDGSLWFSSDRTGFWSLYRWTPDGGVETMVDLGRDIGFPAWVFGDTCYAFLDGGRVAFVVVEDGLDHLAVRMPDGSVERLDVPFTAIDKLTATGSTVHFVGASPTAEPHVVAVDIDGAVAAEPVVVVPPRALPFGDEWFSTPEPVDFPTTGGVTAHALLYRPRNPDVRPPEDERPPALVVIHGGPTSAARPMLRLAYQYWTSRGFAVVDVNHRGSTGYGRAYRELLRGQWGIADVEDCAAVCRHLAQRGDIDPARLCIRGGSAGGFTTLAALANEDVFAAGASYYGVADLAALAADTHKFESRYLDGLIGPWPDGARCLRAPAHRSTTSIRSTAADRVPGTRGRGRPACPVRDDRRRAARQGRPRRLPHVRRRAARVPPVGQHQRRPRRRARLLPRRARHQVRTGTSAIAAAMSSSDSSKSTISPDRNCS